MYFEFHGLFTFITCSFSFSYSYHIHYEGRLLQIRLQMLSQSSHGFCRERIDHKQRD